MSNAKTTMGAEMNQTSAHQILLKVVDPARVAAGYYGTTFHKTKKEAERRVVMFPGSVIERAAP